MIGASFLCSTKKGDPFLRLELCASPGLLFDAFFMLFRPPSSQLSSGILERLITY